LHTLARAVLALCCVLAGAIGRADTQEGAEAVMLQPAETEWRIYERRDRPFRGAIICPLTAPRQGGYLCISFDCRFGRPVALRLTASHPMFPAQLERGSRRLPDPHPFVLGVDGRVVAEMTLQKMWRGRRPADATDYAVPYDRRVHADAVRALRAGREGTIVVGSGEQARRLDFSLAGADVAIGAALEMCPIARYGQMDPDGPFADSSEIPTPGHRIAPMRRGCAALGGDLVLGAGFATVVNPDGDGSEDLMLDYGALSCTDGTRPFCSEAGCLTELWLRDKGQLTRVIAEPLASLEMPGEGVLELRRAACGGSGPPCVTRYLARDGMIWLQDAADR
jgi:hypothetical protein